MHCGHQPSGCAVWHSLLQVILMLATWLQLSQVQVYCGWAPWLQPTLSVAKAHCALPQALLGAEQPMSSHSCRTSSWATCC